MAKFTGFMCDVCHKAENGNDRPEHWIGLRLPGHNGDGTRDLCSDKCLLKFAKERAGGTVRESTPRREKISGLSEFLTSKGVKPGQKGVLSRLHSQRRHEMGIPDEDCLVCEFLSMPTVSED